MSLKKKITIEYFIEFEQFLIANYLNFGYKDDLGSPMALHNLIIKHTLNNSKICILNYILIKFM